MLDSGDRFLTRSVQDLLANRQQIARRLYLCLGDDQVSWGEFPELEAFLVEHDLPFDRFSEGKWEYEPTWTYYRLGQSVRTLVTNPRHEAVVTVSGLHRVNDHLSRLAQMNTSKSEIMRQLQLIERQLIRLLPAPVPLLPSLTVTKS